MNGVVFIEIGKFAQSRLGPQAWTKTIQAAGEPRCMFRGAADCELVIALR